MNPQLKFAAAATLALVALLPAPSLAASVASASLTDFSYQLIDLTPDDGLVVSISFNSPQNSVQASNGGPDDFQTGVGSLSAAVSGAGSATGLVIHVSALNSSLTATSNSSGDYTFATGEGRHFTAFTLSANTQVIFTATASVSITASDAAFENAISIARMQLEAPTGLGAGFSELVSPNFAPLPVSGPVSSQASTVLSVGYANTSFDAITGNVNTWARAVTVNGSLAPVPEPQTWAMLVGGLLLLGRFALRRRN